MDDFMSTLIPIALFLFYVIKKFRKAWSSMEEDDDESMPVDTSWNEVPIEETIYKEPLTSRLATYKREKESKSRQSQQLRENEQRSKVVESVKEEPSEYAINDAEEARKAIIWSEVLQRKYF